MTLIEALKLTEEQAREHIERVLWPKGPVCPHCGNRGAWEIRGESVRAGLYKCKRCHEPFTVTVGTVMHSSHIPLSKWVAAIHMMCSHKKGVSALQLKRDLGLGSYRTAWHLGHRIRLAMNEEPLKRILKGTIECDEAFVGGKTRKHNYNPLREKQKAKAGGWATRKAPVMALVERNGNCVSTPIDLPTMETLQSTILKHCDSDSHIMTDELSGYSGIGWFFNGHSKVKHTIGQYVKGEASINTVEGFFSLLKRAHYGIYHSISKHHLHRYLDEITFRWNYRCGRPKTKKRPAREGFDDSQRAEILLKGIVGRRLIYKETQPKVMES